MESAARRIAAEELVIDGGNAPADVADQLGVPLSAAHLALAYHYANPDETAQGRQRHRERMVEAREGALELPETLTG